MKHTFTFFLCLLTTVQAAAQWIQTSGPEGGTISAFASHNGFIFAGTSGAGVLRSSDGGATWTPANFGYGYPFPTAFLVKGSTLYSATVNVFRTTDNGDSWTGATGLPTGSGVTSLAMDGTFMYAGIASGFGPALVYRSADDGATWQQFSTGSPDYAGVSSLCIDGSVVLAAVSGNGTYRSTDQGQTWSASSNGLPPFSYVNTLAAGGGVVLAGLANSGVWRSTNSGATWSVAASGLPAGATVNSILLDGADVYASASLYTGSAQVYRSTNNGSNWTLFSTSLPPAEIGTLARFNNVFFVGTFDRGAVRSVDNGSSWQWSNTGIINSRVVALATHGSTVYAGTAGDGVYRSTNGGDSWGRMTSGIPDNLKVRAIVTRGTTVIAIGTLRDSVFAYRTTDVGATWSRGASPIPGFGSASSPSQRSALVVGTYLLASIGFSTVWRSTDDGDSWSGGTGISFDNVNALGEVGGSVYAGGSGMYRSTDGGSSWSTASNGLPAYAGFVGIAGIGGDAFTARLYGPEIHRSTSNGVSWSAAASVPGSASSDLMSIGSNLFAGINNGGVAMSSNGGTSWTLVRTGLPLVGIVYHILANSATHLYCGTDVQGVWKRPLSEVVSVGEAATTMPEKISLAQNFPNPFNPTTEIGFAMPNREFVELKVFDLTGREVATLLDGALEAGSYRVTFDAAGLASGVYLYRISAGNFTATKRLVVLK